MMMIIMVACKCICLQYDRYSRKTKKKGNVENPWDFFFIRNKMNTIVKYSVCLFILHYTHTHCHYHYSELDI